MVPNPDPLAVIESWPVPSAGAAIVGPLTSQRRGATDRAFRLASLTKPLFALAILVAVEERSLDLDEPVQVDEPMGGVGPLRSAVTVRQLLSHASGLGPEAGDPVTEPNTRRIYSNAGFELLGGLLTRATGMSASDYFREAITSPLGMANTVLAGSPAHGATATVEDLVLFIQELMRPTLLSPTTTAALATSQFPELSGVVPGYGRHDPNPWGLGFEIRGQKSPHWTSASNSPGTFGHFGRAGTMFWIDPARSVGAVALTNRDFGSWAIEAWPPFGDRVLEQ